jgi:8-hydroxy-5-deazaflavin:NADPH oxidoreductase
VILSVPWGAIPEALGQAGELSDQVVIDTTNQFGAGPKPAPGQTAASFDAQRLPRARYVKSFNTLTAHFQQQAADRDGPDRVVQWICGDDPQAKELVAVLIDDMGCVPVDLGGTQTCQVMEAPRRPGALYGEEYRAADAQAVVDAVRNSKPIPPPPPTDNRPGPSPAPTMRYRVPAPTSKQVPTRNPGPLRRAPISIITCLQAACKQSGGSGGPRRPRVGCVRRQPEPSAPPVTGRLHR